MSRQMITDGSGDAMSNTATEYTCLMGSGNITWSTTENLRTELVSTSGVIRCLRVKLRDAPGAGKSYAFTVMLNGAVSDIGVTISDTDTEGEDCDVVSVSAGDTLSLRSVPTGTPAATDAHWAIIFDSNAEKERLLMSAGISPRQTGTFYFPLHGPVTNQRTEAKTKTHMPMAATIKNLYVKLNTAPGVGCSRLFMVRKNGADTGLFVQITHNDTTGNNTANTVSVSAEDVLSIETTATGFVALAGHYAIGLTAETTDAEEEFMINNSSNVELDGLPAGGGSTKFASISAGNSGMKLSSASSLSLGQPCHLLKYYVELDSAPGATSYRTFAVRKNGADTALTVTIAGANTKGSIEKVIEIRAGDSLNQRVYSQGQFIAGNVWRTSIKAALPRRKIIIQ